MSIYITSFEDIITRELYNRFNVFCNGNSGCNSFCCIHNEIKYLEKISYIVNKEKLKNLYKQCENCTIKKFLDFNEKISR
jgi:hypothetical protein